MNWRHHPSLSRTVPLVFVFTISIAMWVAASGPGPLEQTLPYQGRLEMGGMPFNGSASLTFHLYDDADPNNSAITWSETRSIVASGGAFALRLGENVAIPEAAFSAQELFLAIDVDGTPLAGLQRLGPAWAAVRSEQAVDFSVTGSLAVGVPLANPSLAGTVTVQADHNSEFTDIASFLPENETRGVGITWRGMRSVGTAANIDLQLAPKGTGEVVTTAKMTVDGVDSTYERTLGRWLIKANYHPAFSGANVTNSFYPIDDARLRAYCADEDGCTVRVAMEDWINNPDGDAWASTVPYTFSLEDDVTSGRAWRVSDSANLTAMWNGGFPTRNSAVGGRDGDGTTEHVIHAWNCYFTENTYTAGSAVTNDSGVGFGLLNYNANTAYTPDCVLVIED